MLRLGEHGSLHRAARRRRARAPGDAAWSIPQLGKAVMEAHRTPDGRTATPTIVVLGDDGHVIGAWTERPSSIQTWFLEKQKTTMQKPLHDELMAVVRDGRGQDHGV